MAYIGSTPTTQSFISGTDYFNGDGTTVAFTLSRRVNSVNDIEVLVNNVEQQPNTVYSVSGTTLTFTTAPSAGTQNIYVRYLSTVSQSIVPSQGTVNTAQLGLITTIPTTGGNVVTLPASTGTVALTSQLPVAGSGPAFSAYMSIGQTLSSVTSTVLQFNTKTFDTATCFNNTGSTTTLNGISVPAYSFAPNVAGYYQVSAGWAAAGPSTPGDYSVNIWKNGINNTFQIASGGQANASTYTAKPCASGILYMNGTSDYITVYGYVGTGQTLQFGASVSFFTAALVRTA